MTESIHPPRVMAATGGAAATLVKARLTPPFAPKAGEDENFTAFSDSSVNLPTNTAMASCHSSSDPSHHGASLTGSSAISAASGQTEKPPETCPTRPEQFQTVAYSPTPNQSSLHCSAPVSVVVEGLSSSEFAVAFHSALKGARKNRSQRIKAVEQIIAARRWAFWEEPSGDGVRRVEDYKALLDWRDGHGFTLLHWAAMSGSAEAVLTLLDIGMEVDTRGPNKQTPLMWAVMEEELLVMTILWEKGAEVNARDDLNDNIVTLSAQHEKLLSCMWSISKGADINCCNVTGSTAAHWAAFSGGYILLCLLDSFEANIDESYDHYGLLPLHRALQLEFFATARMLVDLKCSRLESKTRSGEDLTTFAKNNDISKTWFDQWLQICKNPQHKVQIPNKNRLLGTGDISSGVEAARWWQIWKLRSQLWDHFADMLAKMEENEFTRMAVPAVALVFAAIFVAAWKMELWRLNVLVCYMFPRVLARRLQLVVPYAGLFCIGLFLVLLTVNPGVIPRNRTPAQRRQMFALIQDQITDVQFELDLEGTQLSPTTTPLLLRHLKATCGPGGKTLIDLVPYICGDESPPVPTDTFDPFTTEAALKREARRQNALAKIDVNRICPTCWVQKDLRTKHCGVCDCCCELMDHHCVWLNKCVGRRNHWLFVAFVGIAGMVQLYHMFLSFFELVLIGLDRWLSIRPAGSIHPTAIAATILGATGLIHFVTHRWSISLIQSQCSDMAEGITVNESFSMARYDHFICEVEYTYTPEKIGAMKAALQEAGVQPSVKPVSAIDGKKLARRESVQGTEQGIRAKGATKMKSVKLKGIGSEIVPKTKEEQGKSIEETVTRRFIRNPFVINKGTLEIILDFWLGRQPCRIDDYEALLKHDIEYKRKIVEQLRQREVQSLNEGNFPGGSRIWSLLWGNATIKAKEA